MFGHIDETEKNATDDDTVDNEDNPDQSSNSDDDTDMDDFILNENQCHLESS